MTTIQVTAVEQPRDERVLVLGIRQDDYRNRGVGFFVEAPVAVDVLSFANEHTEFPIVEVDDRDWFYVLHTGERQFFHMKEKP